MKVLAIIHCFNEEKNLMNTFENSKVKAPEVDFFIINDGSQDNTYKICTENNYPVVNFAFNLGLSNTVQTGMKYAYINEYDMTLQFDGDGQHLPEYIPVLIQKMKETPADIMIRSRNKYCIY